MGAGGEPDVVIRSVGADKATFCGQQSSRWETPGGRAQGQPAGAEPEGASALGVSQAQGRLHSWGTATPSLSSGPLSPRIANYLMEEQRSPGRKQKWRCFAEGQGGMAQPPLFGFK